MDPFLILFESISTLLAFLAAAILIWVNQNQLYSNRLLAFFLIVLALINLNTMFLYSRLQLNYPYLHKLALPITLLIAPLSWLYIKSVLIGQISKNKKDLLILIPTILCFIDLLPYYTMPIADKKVYLELFYQNQYLQGQFKEGILPPYIFSFIRIIWSAIFIYKNFILIRNFKLKESKNLVKNNLELINWLQLFNWMLLSLLLISLFNSIIAPIFKTNYALVDLATGISVFIICIRLFTKPNLLYGVFNPIVETNSNKTDQFIASIISNVENDVAEKISLIKDKTIESHLTLSKADMVKYKKIIEQFFIDHRPYLKTDYTLEKLVLDTNIPRHIISAFINKEYGIGFREFLNRYRVNYFIEHIHKPIWKNLTLEAIAAECGYTTRSTFISNFKQVTGKTPSEYIKDLQN